MARELKAVAVTTTFFTSANRGYEHFVLPYATCALAHNPGIVVEVCVEDPAAFAGANRDGMAVLDRHFPGGLHVRGGDFADRLPHTVRFVETPERRSEFTYIGDIDILILEEVTPVHIANMRRTGLPYSNVMRPGGKRLSGLHFTRTDAYYPVDTAGVDLTTNDEMVLLNLARKAGLPDPGETFRPMHGFHLSANRRPIGAPGEPSWGLDHAPYSWAWGELVKGELWREIEAHFDDRFAMLCLVLETALLGRYPKPALDQGEMRAYIALLRRLQGLGGPRGASTPAPVDAASVAPDAPATHPDPGAQLATISPAPVSPGAVSPAPAPTAPAVTSATVFGEVFERNLWAGAVKSGPGSTLESTELLREALRDLFAELGIRSLLDAPCGDGTWIHDVTRELDLYLGIDVVPGAVAEAMGRPSLPSRHFHAVGDLSVTRLPTVDAVLCRDCLVHLPLEVAQAVLGTIKASGSTWLLSTTFPERSENRQARLGTWRPLNLALPPFSLPEPVRLIRERRPNPDDKYNDKALGVWRIGDL